MTPAWRAQDIKLRERLQRNEELLQAIVDDFDRRRSKPWGRFLLWLLRKTT